MVKSLIAASANKDALDKDGNPPIYYANNPNTIELLVTQENVNHVDKNGNSLIHNSLDN